MLTEATRVSGHLKDKNHSGTNFNLAKMKSMPSTIQREEMRRANLALPGRSRAVQLKREGTTLHTYLIVINVILATPPLPGAA
jgi:hypothetical protein